MVLIEYNLLIFSFNFVPDTISKQCTSLNKARKTKKQQLAIDRCIASILNICVIIVNGKEECANLCTK